jgi:hypothetical protein
MWHSRAKDGFCLLFNRQSTTTGLGFQKVGEGSVDKSVYVLSAYRKYLSAGECAKTIDMYGALDGNQEWKFTPAANKANVYTLTHVASARRGCARYLSAGACESRADLFDKFDGNQEWMGRVPTGSLDILEESEARSCYNGAPLHLGRGARFQIAAGVGCASARVGTWWLSACRLVPGKSMHVLFAILAQGSSRWRFCNV